MKIARDYVPYPQDVGFRYGGGEPKGQNADHRLALDDGHGIHVKEYDECYLVHWDRVDPSVDSVQHLAQDAPQWVALGAWW